MWENLLHKPENVNDNKEKWVTKESFVIERKRKQGKMGKFNTYAMEIAIYI